MEITGIVKELCPIESGEGKNGHWESQMFVVESTESHNVLAISTRYPHLLANISVGQKVIVGYYINSRKYQDKNGVWRWSTELRSNRISAVSGDAPTTESIIDNV